MKVLITAATDLELTTTKAKASNSLSLDIDYLTTGVGMMATVYHLMAAIQKKEYDLLIQLGIAGSFDFKIPLGTAVCVADDVVAEMGVVENNEYKDIFTLQLADANSYPYQAGLLANPNKEMLLKTRLPHGKAVTVNQISTDHEVVNRYTHKYNAAIESMEGAALHYVGLMEHIPFLQIRGISNYVGERNKENWKINEAMQAYNEACINLLQQL